MTMLQLKQLRLQTNFMDVHRGIKHVLESVFRDIDGEIGLAVCICMYLEDLNYIMERTCILPDIWTESNLFNTHTMLLDGFGQDNLMPNDGAPVRFSFKAQFIQETQTGRFGAPYVGLSSKYRNYIRVGIGSQSSTFKAILGNFGNLSINAFGICVDPWAMFTKWNDRFDVDVCTESDFASNCAFLSREYMQYRINNGNLPYNLIKQKAELARFNDYNDIYDSIWVQQEFEMGTLAVPEHHSFTLIAYYDNGSVFINSNGQGFDGLKANTQITRLAEVLMNVELVGIRQSDADGDFGLGGQGYVPVLFIRSIII